MTTMQRAPTTSFQWPLGKIVLAVASLVSALALFSGLVAYPVLDLALVNLICCFFLVAIGVWLGTNNRIDSWLALGLGNGAVIAGLVCWILAGLTIRIPFVEALFLMAAVLFLIGYAELGGWLIRQCVRRFKTSAGAILARSHS